MSTPKSESSSISRRHFITKALMATGGMTLSPAFVPEASAGILDSFLKKPEETLTDQPTIFACGYTHLDDQWRWSFPQVIREFIPLTLHDNFERFEKYPHFTFNWSGSCRYEMIKEYYPEDFATMAKWIEKGRWFPCGSAYDENDVNLPNSESIIRQILFGYRYFKSEFNKESNEYLLPDCFGFPASLPSVLAHCGLRGFSTQKLTWGSAVGIPFNVGRWIGPDGRSVIAALNGGNYAGAHKKVYTVDPEWVKRLEENKQRSGMAIDFLYVGGGDQNNNADRGGSPQKISLDNMEKCYSTPGPVRVIAGTSDMLFKSVSDEQAKKFPTYQGDLLLVQHSTGILTSQTYMKKLNRDGELLGDAAERAAVTATLLGADSYPAESLRQGWGLVLKNQFHDTLPGTCLPKAYEYAWNDGIVALNQLAGVYEDAVGAISRGLDTQGEGVALVLFNPLSIDREDVVEALIPSALANAKSLRAVDVDGNGIPTQIVTGFDGVRKVIFSAKVPSVGCAVYRLQEGESSQVSSLKATTKEIENDYYRVAVNAQGDIASIYDKREKREILSKPAQMEFLYNFPEKKPAWRIYWKDIIAPARSVAKSPLSLRVIESGPVRVAIEVVRENEGSNLIQRIQLCSGPAGERVEVANRIDWRSPSTLLKASFPMTISNPRATYNQDLGTIERGNRHEKQYEVPNHAWIDLTDKSGEYGVTFLTGHKYGSDKPDDGTIRLTLIHTPGTEDEEDETRDKGKSREQRWQDWGRNEFSYAIVGHPQDWRQAGAHWHAQRFEQKISAFAVSSHSGVLGKKFSLIQAGGTSVAIQAIKRAEDGEGIVIRMQELQGKPSTSWKLTPFAPIAEARELDGVERMIAPLLPTNGKLELDFSPYQLRTIGLRINSPKMVSGPEFVPVSLPLNIKALSRNSNRFEGSFDGRRGSYPAEMFPKEWTIRGVTHKLGKVTEANALACESQTITIPKGARRLHFLAAAREKATGTFQLGENKFELSIADWSGYRGQWDNRVFEGEVQEVSYSLRNNLLKIDPAYVHAGRIAWHVSHRHVPSGDTLYDYGYFYSYQISIPEAAEKLVLPDNPEIVILAMGTATRDSGDAESLWNIFEDLQRDQAFEKRFSQSAA